MSAGTMNGALLPQRSDSSAARCLNLLDAGLARYGLGREAMVPAPNFLTRHWEGLPGVTYPNLAEEKIKGRPRKPVQDARRVAILESYARTRSMQRVARELRFGMKVIYRVLRQEGVQLQPRGAHLRKGNK
jgi:hypothetical protein